MKRDRAAARRREHPPEPAANPWEGQSARIANHDPGLGQSKPIKRNE